jgi:hypothetical protein
VGLGRLWNADCFLLAGRVDFGYLYGGHGTFSFFTVNDQLDARRPGLMSAMVIVVAMSIARKYGKNLDMEMK